MEWKIKVTAWLNIIPNLTLPTDGQTEGHENSNAET